MHVICDCASTLGSRFNLIFDPHDSCLYHNAYGDFHEQPFALTAGLRLENGRLVSLPFATRPESFPYVEQSSGLTTIEYSGVLPERRVEVSMKIRAPFYPHNAKLSTAPVYYVDLTVSRLDGWRWTDEEDVVDSGELLLRLHADDVEFEQLENGFAYSFDSTSELREGPEEEQEITSTKTCPVRCSVRATGEINCGESEISIPFDLSEDDQQTLSLIWSSWSDNAVLETNEEATEFKYKEFFASENKLLEWAEAKRGEVEEQCDFLEGLFSDWSLGSTTTQFTALALHSFLANSWWTTRQKKADWFSVWEGSCYFHSTIDVEYNDGLIYFALWPELLDMLLSQWAQFEVEADEHYNSAKNGSFLCHDMGANHVVGRQIYPHYMEIEENANYLLLMAARCFFTGDLKLAQKHLDLCRRLADFIVQCDTDGNGFPDQGTANTIDDASPALQYGKEQTYLAVKSSAALWAWGEVEDLLVGEKKSKAERWKAFASKAVKSLNEKAWVKDHYAVTLTRTTEGLVDPWTGTPLPDGELEGWDDFSIYTANGLLYLYLANIKMPRWNEARFARDIENAERATRQRYGSSHTASGDRTVWFSQNLWRDYVAAYLGIDMLQNIESYWDYQVLTGDNQASSLYYDTTPENNLNFYPRGATVLGAPMSAAGMRLNRIEGELHLCPVRKTLRVPLLPLVDWREMRAPWLVVRSRQGVTVAQITEEDLLGNLTVHLTGAEMESA